MKSSAGILFRLFVLLAFGIGSVLLADAAWKSVTHYRTPYSFRADLPAGEPLIARLVLIVMDGVRLDVSRNMPFLQQLAGRGAAGSVRVGIPSLSNPGRATMVTGAWPEIHGVTNNGRFFPPEVDSLFSLAAKQRLPAATAGSNFWERAFGEYLGGEVLVQAKEKRLSAEVADLLEWQHQICRAMVDFLLPRGRGLLVAEINAADSAGHNFGGESEAYAKVAEAVDECLRTLVTALDGGGTTFVVTSDHGHIERRGAGGHGGSEEEVLLVPLVLAGKAIRPGGSVEGDQTDIAPTICALLGLPLPAASQGRILSETLEASAEQQAALRAREAGQRELAESKLPDREKGLAIERRGRSLRALAFFTLFWFTACGIVLFRGADWPHLLGAVAVFYVAYYALFWVFGLQYSLSAINREEFLGNFFLRNALAAAGAVLAGAAFLIRRAGKVSGEMLLDFGIVAAATAAIQVTSVYYWFGLFMRGFMPDVQWSFKAYLDLLMIAAIAASAPVVSLGWRVLMMRTSRLRTEAGALQTAREKEEEFSVPPAS